MTTGETNSAGIQLPVPLSQGGSGSADGALPLDGGTMLGNLILNGDPTLALQAVTKQYADAISAGFIFKAPCLCMATGPLTVTYYNGAGNDGIGATLTDAGTQAVLLLDGVSPSVGDRVLIVFQSDATQNGIYVVTDVGSIITNWVLTRATDYDTPAQIVPGTYVIVTSGTTYQLSSWLQTATVTTIGTDPIVFGQFSAGVGANTALSNLITTSINQALLPSADATHDIGDQNLRWTNAYAENIKTGQTASNPLNIAGYDTNAASYKNFLAITAGNPPTAALDGSVTGITQTPSDGSTKLATTEYVDIATGGGVGANAALSNLASVAINTSLLAGSDNAIDLGSAANRWRNALIEAVQTGQTATQTLLLQAYNTNTAAYVTFGTLTANDPPTMTLSGSVTSVTQSPLDGSTKLATTEYVDLATGGGSGANTALSNLVAVAINTALLAGTDNAITLGNATFRFSDLFATDLKTGTTNGQTLKISGYDTGNSAYTDFITVTANNPTTMSLSTGVTAITQLPADASTKIATTAYADNSAGLRANTSLSNLSSVAINTSLLPASDVTQSLGEAAHRWLDAYISDLKTGTTAAQTLKVSGYNTGATNYTDFITVTAGSTSTCALSSGITAITQSPLDGSTKIATTQYADLAAAAVAPSYPIAVNKGGTGVASLTTAYGTLCAGTTATGNVQTVSPGSAALPLVSGGSSALPSYAGLTVPGGGTGVVSATAYAPIVGGTTTTGALQSAGTGQSTSGNVYTSNGSSAAPSFQPPSATSGGLVLLATVSASASASVEFANNFSATYNDYLILYDNVVHATTNTIMEALVGYGGTPTYSSSGYTAQQLNASSTTVGATAGPTTYIGVSNNTFGSASLGTAGSIEILGANNTSNFVVFNNRNTYVSYSSSNIAAWLSNVGWSTSGNAMTSIKFLISSGNITTGNFYLYGYQK